MLNYKCTYKEYQTLKVPHTIKIKIKQTYKQTKKMTVEPTMTIQGTGHNFFKRSHSILRRIIEYIYKNKDKMQWADQK